MTGLAYADTRGSPSPAHQEDLGREKVYPHPPGQDGRGGVHPALHPCGRTDTGELNTTDEGKPVFPLPVRDVLWYEVHGMGVALGMRENLSYHMARHSFGTLTLTAGIPIESIARMMGHTNIDSTQVYAQVTDRKISSDMDRLMERRKSADAAGKEAAD